MKEMAASITVALMLLLSIPQAQLLPAGSEAPTRFWLTSDTFLPPSVQGATIGVVSVGWPATTPGLVINITGGPDRALFTMSPAPPEGFALVWAVSGAYRKLYQVQVTAINELGNVSTTLRIYAGWVPPYDLNTTGPMTYFPPCPQDTPVGTVQAYSYNEGDSFAYVLTQASPWLYLQGNTLMVRRGATENTLSLVVTATDQGWLTLTRSFNVTAINRAPYGLQLTVTKYLPPGQPGTVVGLLSSLDYNPGDSFTYSLTGGPSADHFTISGAQLLLRYANETTPSMVVEVTTKDQGGLSYAREFTVTAGACPYGWGGDPTTMSCVISLAPSPLLNWSFSGSLCSTASFGRSGGGMAIPTSAAMLTSLGSTVLPLPQSWLGVSAVGLNASTV
eukprot:RCo014680